MSLDEEFAIVAAVTAVRRLLESTSESSNDSDDELRLSANEKVGVVTAVTGIKRLLDSSSDSSSENELTVEFSRNKPMELRPRIEGYVKTTVFQYSDEEFKSHFRMSLDTFHFLLHTISPFLNGLHGRGQPRISAEKQILIAIWTFATPDSYRSVCDRFDVGRATAVRSVRRVTNALYRIAPQFIKWNDDLENVTPIGEAHGFPGVIGAIDGTHINIRAPRENPESYVNRKGRHSIQLQVICDNKMQFMHCYTGQPGSVHDQRVFRLSNVQNILDDDDKFPNNSHILGDCAYAIQKRLLVPYKDNGHLTVRQKNYNYCLSSARMVVERSLALLKGRFRSLLDCLPMTRVDLIPRYIIACCVLHNICLVKNDQFQELLVIENDNSEHEMRNIPATGRADGLTKRVSITNSLPMRLM